MATPAPSTTATATTVRIVLAKGGTVETDLLGKGSPGTASVVPWLRRPLRPEQPTPPRSFQPAPSGLSRNCNSIGRPRATAHSGRAPAPRLSPLSAGPVDRRPPVSDVLPQIGLVFVLVLCNAAFAGTELALVSLRDGQLQRLEARGGTGAVLARLAREPNRFLATIQIGITVAGFLASASAAVSLAEPLESPLGFLGGAAGGASIVVVTIILSYVTLVLGELVPKRIAMQRAERWGLLAARPLSFLSKVTRPAAWLLSRSTDLVVRALGGDPHLQAEDVTKEELRDMVASQSSFSPAQRTIIDGAFEIASRTLHEVLRPRGEVFVLDADDPCATSLDRLAASAHSRAPVAPGANLDATTGVVHLRDLLGGGERPTGDVATPPLVLPEPAGVLESLRRMQVERSQLAVVVNEHGGAEGIITLEDLI
ncbi:MAG: HlyC/CorC family transporter, partial [Acidimicrobiia bacterium]|nr:HlyC/CorC family transporter [Acidimicrobiia bacterium]